MESDESKHTQVSVSMKFRLDKKIMKNYLPLLRIAVREIPFEGRVDGSIKETKRWDVSRSGASNILDDGSIMDDHTHLVSEGRSSVWSAEFDGSALHGPWILIWIFGYHKNDYNKQQMVCRLIGSMVVHISGGLLDQHKELPLLNLDGIEFGSANVQWTWNKQVGTGAIGVIDSLKRQIQKIGHSVLIKTHDRFISYKQNVEQLHTLFVSIPVVWAPNVNIPSAIYLAHTTQFLREEAGLSPEQHDNTQRFIDNIMTYAVWEWHNLAHPNDHNVQSMDILLQDLDAMTDSKRRATLAVILEWMCTISSRVVAYSNDTGPDKNGDLHVLHLDEWRRSFAAACPLIQTSSEKRDKKEQVDEDNPLRLPLLLPDERMLLNLLHGMEHDSWMHRSMIVRLLKDAYRIKFADYADLFAFEHISGRMWAEIKALYTEKNRNGKFDKLRVRKDVVLEYVTHLLVPPLGADCEDMTMTGLRILMSTMVYGKHSPDPLMNHMHRFLQGYTPFFAVVDFKLRGDVVFHIVMILLDSEAVGIMSNEALTEDDRRGRLERIGTRPALLFECTEILSVNNWSFSEALDMKAMEKRYFEYTEIHKDIKVGNSTEVISAQKVYDRVLTLIPCQDLFQLKPDGTSDGIDHVEVGRGGLDDAIYQLMVFGEEGRLDARIEDVLGYASVVRFAPIRYQSRTERKMFERMRTILYDSSPPEFPVVHGSFEIPKGNNIVDQFSIPITSWVVNQNSIVSALRAVLPDVIIKALLIQFATGLDTVHIQLSSTK